MNKALILACCILTIYSNVLSGAESSAWEKLLSATPQAATAEFEKSVAAAKDNEDQLVGLQLAYSFSSNEPKQWQALKQLVSATLNKNSGAVHLKTIINHAWANKRNAQLADFFESIAEKKILPRNRLVINDFLAGHYNQRWKFEEAKKKYVQVGRIHQFARVVGPFSSPCRQYMQTPLEPEKHPAADNFKTQSNIEVKTRVDQSADVSGLFYLKPYRPPYPMRSIFYIQVTLQADSAKDILLRFNNDHDNKVWLNTLPIVTPHTEDMVRLSRGGWYKVNLKKGINTIMVKTDAKWFAMSLLNTDFTPAPDIRSLMYDPAHWKEAACKPVVGYVFSKFVDPFKSLMLEQSSSISSQLTRALAYYHYHQWDNAEQTLRGLLAKHPKSPLLLTTSGKFFLARASSSSESYKYPIKSAEKLFRQSLNICKDNPEATHSLAKIFIDSKQPEPAIKLLQPLVKAQPANTQARLMLADLYSDKDWHALAANEYDAYCKLRPDDLKAKIQTYEIRGQIDKKYAAQNAAIAKHEYLAYQALKIMLEQNKLTQAQELLDHWDSRYPPAKFFFINDRFNLPQKKPDYPAIIALLEQYTKLMPYQAEYPDRLGIEYVRSGKTQLAEKYFTKALEVGALCQEINLGIVRRLQDLKNIKSPVFDYDLTLDIKQTEKIRKQPESRASYATVVRNQTTRIFPSQAEIKYIHDAIKVFDKDGISSLSEISIPEKATIITCRTIAEDGSIFIPDSSENLELNKAMSMYKVAPNSTLEYSYIHYPENYHTTTINETFNFQDYNAEVKHGKYTLILPRSALDRLDIQTYPKDFKPQITEMGEDVALTWTSDDNPGKIPEPMPSSIKPNRKSVKITLYPESERPSGKFDSRIQLSKLNYEPINEKAREITKDLSSDKEKYTAIYNWISQNITNNSRHNSFRDCFVLSSGSAFAKTKLMRYMLNSIGIRSEMVKTNLQFFSYGTLENRAELAGDFNSSRLLQIYGKTPDTDSWTGFPGNRGVSKLYNIDDIGKGLIGTYALASTEHGMALSRIYPQINENTEATTREFILENSGNAKVSGGFYCYGSNAGNYRKYFINPHQAKKFASRVASVLFNRISDYKATYPKGRELTAADKPDHISILISGNVKDYCNKVNGNKLSFTPACMPSIKPMATPLPRHDEMEISSDVIMSNTDTFTAPKGMAFQTIPEDNYIRSSFGVFSSDYTLVGNKLSISRYAIIPAQTIKAKDCAKFNDFIDSIALELEKSITLIKIPQNSKLLSPTTTGTAEKPYPPAKFRVMRLPKNIMQLMQK